MKNNIYFIDEISKIKKLKREINNIQKKVNLKINLTSSISSLFLTYSNFLKEISLIIRKNILNFTLIFLGYTIFICLILNILGFFLYNFYFNLNTFNYNNDILLVFYSIIFTIAILTAILTYYIISSKFDILKHNNLMKNYGLGENRQLSVISINKNNFLFPKKINFSKIVSQLNFTIDLLININKIEGTLDIKNKNKLKKFISNILKYKDYISYIKLFEIDSISKEKIYKYYIEIISFIDTIDEEIKEIKNTQLYKFNFGQESKKLKKQLEKRYTYINKQISKIKLSIKETKDKEIKKELNEILELLEKEEKELNIIRKGYTNIDILKKKIEIINKLDKEFNYINKENNNIKGLEKENDHNDLLKIILQK